MLDRLLLMRETIRANIEAHGLHLAAVFSDGTGSMPFIYTVGNHGRGLPELLYVGGCGGGAGSMLNALTAAMVDRGHAFEDGETVTLAEGFQVRLFATDDRAIDRFAVQAANFYGDDPALHVLQVIVGDEAGRFPGDEGCDPRQAAQTLLRAGA